MMDQLKADLTAAFEFVGAEAIQRGMRVFDHVILPCDDRDTACRCFGGFAGAVQTEPTREELAMGWGNFCLGPWDIADRHQRVISEAFEGRRTRSILRALATEWLESARTPQMETA